MNAMLRFPSRLFSTDAEMIAQWVSESRPLNTSDAQSILKRARIKVIVGWSLAVLCFVAVCVLKAHDVPILWMGVPGAFLLGSPYLALDGYEDKERLSIACASELVDLRSICERQPLLAPVIHRWANSGDPIRHGDVLAARAVDSYLCRQKAEISMESSREDALEQLRSMGASENSNESTAA